MTSQVKIRMFAQQLSQTLHVLRQVESEKSIYGFNMTKAIYKKLLSQPVDWPPKILEILRFYQGDYSVQFFNRSEFSASCRDLF